MISFTIKGNHEDPSGNPLPKHRLTRRQQWSDKAERYHEYLEYVRGAFLDAIAKRGVIKAADKWMLEHIGYTGRKPLFTGTEKCRMKIFIHWSSKAHGDPENVFGAIADAIFEQDKYLAGSFDWEYCPKKQGRVDVEIEIGVK